MNLEDYSGLEELVSGLTSKATRLNDGRWDLVSVYKGLYALFLANGDWNGYLKKLKKWQETQPRSAAAAIAEAIYWNAYAWNARGTGYASSVTPKGWKLFKKRLRRAEAVLRDSEDYATQSPLWYTTYLHIALGLGWDRDRLVQLFERATRRHPQFHDYYFTLVKALSPKWGGSYEQVDAFIRGQTGRMDKDDGLAFYTRMYWFLQDLEGASVNLFRDTPVSWETMKQGFLVLEHRYPLSFWNLNNFATFSCMAGDKETYRALRPRFDKYVTGPTWPSNYSMDVCDQMMLTEI